MDAILTTAINFNSKEDVEIYKQFSPEALPDGDRRYSGVSTFKIGFENIVLLDQGGYLIAKKPRRAFKSLAIDGEPVKINGPEFKRIGCDEPKDDKVALNDFLQSVGDTVQDAIDNGMQFRVAWMSYIKDDDGNNIMGYADFADSQTAEDELDARLKTEQEAIIIGLIN